MNHAEIANFNPIRNDFVVPHDFIPIRRYRPEEVLNNQAIYKFSNAGLGLREVQLFSTKPKDFTGIHIDGHEISNLGALNFVIDGIGYMKWYSSSNKNSFKLASEAKTNYMLFRKQDCVEIDSCKITNLTLVQICVPHNIVNDSDKYRYCFSIRFQDNQFDYLLDKLTKIPWTTSLN